MKEELDSAQTRSLSLQDYWEVLSRRRWCWMGPLFLCGLLGFAVAQRWPLVYRSEALILVEQQRVPEQYVTPNVIANLRTRLDGMTKQILSRTTLQRIIEQFNLYPWERARVTTDEVVDKMRRHISVELVQTQGQRGDLTGFRIYYSAPSPQTAQRITNELTSLFIDENLRARTQQSQGTTAFLENELEEARKDLTQQEDNLRQYKLRYLGELPEQQQGNLQILSSLEAQLNAATAALGRAEQQKVYFEAMRAQQHAMKDALASQQELLSRSADESVTSLTAIETVLEDLRKQLTTLRMQYTPQHPDLVRFEKLVQEWEARRQRIRAELKTDRKGEPRPLVTGTLNEQGLMEVESRLRAVEPEIGGSRQEVERLRRRIAEYQTRVDRTPLREQQLAGVTRNRDNARGHYQSLLQKKQQSELATNLELRQQGEQFRILDPATLPRLPEGRTRIIVMGWLLGLCAGIGLTVLREVTDNAVHGEKEVSQCTPVPVLVSIPVLRSRWEETRQRFSRRLEVAVAALLVLLSLGAGVQTYLTG